MAEREWVRPELPREAAGTAWAGRPAARFELRPLSLGEVLDRTFALYRSRLPLFAAISMIAATVSVISQAISLATVHQLSQVAHAPGQTPAAAIASVVTTFSSQADKGYLLTLILMLVTAVTQAATALAVMEVYLGKEVHAQDALRKTLPLAHRWIAIALWQLGSLLSILLVLAVPGGLLVAFGSRTNSIGLAAVGAILLALALLGGLPAGFILYLRNALAVPAAVTEGLTIRQAMRRSKQLASGSKGRIFVVLFIAFCLLEVVGLLQAPIAFLMFAAPNQQHILARGAALVIVFVGHTVVAPVALIGLTLLYIDQRVRKEAFDLEFLLQRARGEQTGTQVELVVPQTPEGYAPPL